MTGSADDLTDRAPDYSAETSTTGSPVTGTRADSCAADAYLDRTLLVATAADLGVALDDDQLEQLHLIAREIVVWNQHTNLTRITEPADMARLHFADSLAALRGLPDASWRAADLSCVDIGSGGGLPGTALAVVCPGWRVVLSDSAAKKTTFLTHLNDVLAASSFDVLTARAEDIGRMPAHRAGHDIVVARAVADLPVLAEYAIPLLRTGGQFIALKGRDTQEEVDRASYAIDTLGGTLRAVDAYDLGGGVPRRYVVVVEKTGVTPDTYPRRAGMPSKRPLA